MPCTDLQQNRTPLAIPFLPSPLLACKSDLLDCTISTVDDLPGFSIDEDSSSSEDETLDYLSPTIVPVDRPLDVTALPCCRGSPLPTLKSAPDRIAIPITCYEEALKVAADKKIAGKRDNPE